MTAPSCPRCGYDLSGLASSWRETCPLEGVCSECGLTVRWAELLNPMLTVPAWSFEHALPGRAVARALSTWRRALQPDRFWRAIRLEHPVRPRRLVVMLLVLLVLTHLIVFGATVWLHYAYAFAAPVWWTPPTLLECARGCLWPYRIDRWILHSTRPLRFEDMLIAGATHWFFLAWYVLTPASFLVLGETMRRVKVRYVHLWRAAVYSLAPLPAFMAVYAAGQLLAQTTSFGASAAASLRWPPTFLLAMWALAAGWLIRYWWWVPRRYLRLPHAAAVSIVLLGVSGLAAAVLVVVISIVDIGAW